MREKGFDPMRKPPAPLAFLIFLSGVTGLALEVVWARQLQYFFGSATLSISTTLTAYFGGMVLGAWFFARFFERKANLILVGALEIGIGLLAFLSPWMFEQLQTISYEVFCRIGSRVPRRYLSEQL